eukprot:2218153-Rhodomonas_salina.2
MDAGVLHRPVHQRHRCSFCSNAIFRSRSLLSDSCTCTDGSARASDGGVTVLHCWYKPLGLQRTAYEMLGTDLEFPAMRSLCRIRYGKSNTNLRSAATHPHPALTYISSRATACANIGYAAILKCYASTMQCPMQT